MSKRRLVFIPGAVSLGLLISVLLAGDLDLNDLFNYEDQLVPGYITRDNTQGNEIEDAVATLGRVLFYDETLSIDDSISCASCHQQEFAFSDPDAVSTGVAGVTGRHSMRLLNARFSDERRFFWDERAATLEDQVTQPIQDHVEMGFSGENGNPDFDDLIVKMEGTPYYRSLFRLAFGDSQITEQRMQLALAQFVRSLQSFDSKFDQGLAVTGNQNAPFPNFTPQENRGKNLYLAPPQFAAGGQRIGGGVGCQGCHSAPEFSIAPNSRNNGVISVAGNPDDVDLTNTRSPSLRDLFSPLGELNGPMMHDGSFTTIQQVLNHYNDITFDGAVNPNLDPRLRGGRNGPGQKLNMTNQERGDLVAFLQTLGGINAYVDEKYSDPFDEDGSINVMGNVDIERIEIDDNTGQRSAVSMFKVYFPHIVAIEEGAVEVIQRSSSTAPTFEMVGVTTTTETVAEQTVLTIQFDDHVRNGTGILEDGNYELKLYGHLILRDGVPMGMDFVLGENENDNLFSYFGDSDGDRDVDNVDLARFLGTYRRNAFQTGFDFRFDYDEDGDVDNVDLARFLGNYRRSLPFNF